MVHVSFFAVDWEATYQRLSETIIQLSLKTSMPRDSSKTRDTFRGKVNYVFRLQDMPPPPNKTLRVYRILLVGPKVSHLQFRAVTKNFVDFGESCKQPIPSISNHSRPKNAMLESRTYTSRR